MSIQSYVSSVASGVGGGGGAPAGGGVAASLRARSAARASCRWSSIPHCGRMRATEHAPRGPFYLLERRHGLAEIVERGGGVLVERLRVNPPHPERGLGVFSENASRHGHRFAQQ